MEPDLILRGERAALGPLRLDLAATYARWFNDPEARRSILRRGLYTPESEARAIERDIEEMARSRPTLVHFTIYDVADLAPVGSAGLFGIDHMMGRAGYGIMVGERRGRGLGTDATRLILRWAFEDLSLHNVMLEAMDFNESALRAYTRAGFKEIGRRRASQVVGGRRCDEVLMDAIAPDFT